MVRGAACDIYKPRTGDVCLLHPTYYHSIERVGGSDRLTMGFFIGLSSGALDETIVWS